MAIAHASIEPVIYEFIERWIKEQQRMPTPLSEKLHAAILSLELAIKSETPELPEPDVGEDNWIGTLQEYRASSPLASRRDVYTISAVDPSPIGALHWVCQVTIAEDPQPSLPVPTEDGRHFSFLRKKDAKKYAAKCAVEWLREKGYMPAKGVKLPKGFASLNSMKSPPVSPQQQQSPPGPSRQQQSPPRPARQQQSPPRPSQQQKSPPRHSQGQQSPNSIHRDAQPKNIPVSPFDDSEPSAIHQVSQLCNALGLRSPTYKLESPNKDGMFSGHADFGEHNGLLPFDISMLPSVEHVLGQRPAKEALAEEILKLLLPTKTKRDIEAEALFTQASNKIGRAVAST